MKSKVLLIGPIGDFGGRDVEVQLITNALETTCDIHVCSTGYISSASFALTSITKDTFTSIQKEQYKSSWRIKCTAWISYLIHGRKNEPYYYVKNQLSLRQFDFKRSSLHIIQTAIATTDIVFFIGQLTSTYLIEIADYCLENKTPLIVRTTGTIDLPYGIDLTFLENITMYIHHSEANAQNMPSYLDTSYAIIDQAATTETTLLKIPPLTNTVKVYGFIGRLSKEKGLLELLEILDLAPDERLIIAGDGVLREAVKDAIEGRVNVKYMGQLSREGLQGFYATVDCVIISSYEESGPLVGLEAMAAGKLIISTDVGAMKERLEEIETQFWFDIKTPQTFIKEKERMCALNSEEVHRISLSLRQRYTSRYMNQTIAQRYRTIVSELLS